MRARVGLVVLLAVTGCSKNLDELRAIKASLELQLAEKKEIAQNLSLRRRELDMLDQVLMEAAADAGITYEQVQRLPIVPPPPPASTWEMPPESIWEGPQGPRLRQQIADLRGRIAELEREIGEVNTINLRKREVEAKLKALSELRRKRAAQSPTTP